MFQLSRITRECRSNRLCSTCNGKHHTLLHEAYAFTPSQTNFKLNPDANSHVPKETKSGPPNVVTTMSVGISVGNSKGVLLSTALIQVIGPHGIQLFARALIDPCSQVSIITRSLCQRLQLKQRAASVKVGGVGDEINVVAKGIASLSIKPRFESDFRCEVEALILKRISNYSPPKISSSVNFDHIKGLELADPYFANKSQIDVLLCASVHAQIIESQIIKGNPDQPIAMASLLGWLLSGCIGAQPTTDSVSSFHVSEDSHLADILQSFWRLEDVPYKTLLTAEEQKCEAHFASNHFRTSSGRYGVKLPFKNSDDISNLKLSESYSTALRMLKVMEGRFKRNENSNPLIVNLCASIGIKVT